MDENREELRQRREALKIRIRRKQKLTLLSDVINCLDARSVSYEFLWDEEDNSTDWIEGHFPIVSYGRVDWQRVAGATCHSGKTDQALCELVKHALSTHARNEEDEIIIAWSSNKPAIQLKVGDVYACLEEILSADFDTWIYMPESTWLIEVYHEGEVCSGSAP